MTSNIKILKDLDFYAKDDIIDIEKYSFVKPNKSINLSNSFNKSQIIQYVNNFSVSLEPFINYLNNKHINITNSVVSYRSALRQIMITPFTKYTWSCDAYKKNGTIFLIEHYEPKFYDNVLKGIHYNDYFRKYCCNMDTDIYHATQWRIADINLFIASLVDGQYNGKPIKLKMLNKKANFKSYKIDLWSQCYLDNIHDCVCGFYEVRDSSNVVCTKLHRYTLSDLTTNIDTDTCINTMITVITNLFKNLKNNQMCTIERDNYKIKLSNFKSI